ncbi:uncharacterized protein LOC9637734 [Selaginella moellendorffii]|uniref:uncharacterized protein LOC9637734 n=1 Tax=Selaginella moellendorffii TaxID=88036 RepID=UPI000D1CE42A|nr:uncharacterized protein LOC9637734 [Selaginella moellendorffii]|eukprot:XP_024535710.1 uncharacterized protein LOC9637734 [Selaginella moellendorffii]
MFVFDETMRRWKLFLGSVARFSRSPHISRSISSRGDSRSLVSEKNPPLRSSRHFAAPMDVAAINAAQEWIHIHSSSFQRRDSHRVAATITRHDRDKRGEPLLANWKFQFGSLDVFQFGTMEMVSIQAKSLEKSQQDGMIQQLAPSLLPASLEELQFGSVDHHLLERRTVKNYEEGEGGGGGGEGGDLLTARLARKRYQSEEEQIVKNSLSTSTMGLSFSCGKRGFLSSGEGVATTKRSKAAMRSFSSSSQPDLLPQALKFKLPSGECKLVLQRGDITKWKIDGESDAIVNAANELMMGGGGVDGAIHRAAGGELLRACRDLPSHGGVRCGVGMAVETPGFQLPVQRIIHTVGPVYDKEVKDDCAAYLASAYRNSIKLAREKGVKYIAFPAISCGIYGYPLDDAAKISLNTIKENSEGFSEIHFVLFEPSAWQTWVDLAKLNFEHDVSG